MYLTSLLGMLWPPWPLLSIGGVLFAWWLASFAALMVLRESMRRCKVLLVHVLRVCAHSVVPVIPGAASAVSFAFLGLNFGSSQLLEELALFLNLVAPLAVIAHAIWSIRCGYVLYLRMPHALGVAIATQVIAVLVVANLYLAVGFLFF